MKELITLPFLITIITSSCFLIAILSIYKNRILWSMSLRNAFKRKSTTILLIVGSLVGTALITGSQVINDSFQFTALEAVRTSLGEVDLTVTSRSTGGFTASELQRARGELLEIDMIDDVASLNTYQVSLQKVVGQEKESLKSNVKLSTGNWEILNSFGSDESVNEPITHPTGGDALITDELASSLDLNIGDTISIYVFGSEIQVDVAGIIQGSGVSGPSRAGHVILNDRDIRALLNLLPDSYNTLYVSYKGGMLPDDDYDPEDFEEFVATAMESADIDSFNFEITEEKDTLLRRVTGNGTEVIFSALSIFGAFAGALLIINIFLMLAEERRSEMGILRAIGLKRGDLVKAFAYEGLIYASLSSLLGTVVGIGIGYGIVTLISLILAQFLSVFGVNAEILFDITLGSTVAAFSAGFLFTFITTLLASYFISGVNIVSAIREIPEERIETKRGALLGWSGRGLLLLWGAGLLLSAESIQKEVGDLVNIKGTIIYIGVILLILGAMALLSKFIRKNYHSRSERILIRIVHTVGSLGVTLFSLYVTSNDQFVESLQQNPSFFFIVGLGIVIGSVVLVTHNLDLITILIQQIFRPFRRFVATVRIAVRYPSCRPTRIGMTLAIYSVIVFMVTFISLQRSSLDLALDGIRDSVLGTYDGIVLINNETNFENIDSTLQEDPDMNLVISGVSLMANFPDEKVQMMELQNGPPSPANLANNGQLAPYTDMIYLASNKYLSETELEFKETYKGITSEEVWDKMRNEPDRWVILSGKFGLELPFFPEWSVEDEIMFKPVRSDEPEVRRQIIAMVDPAFGGQLPYGDIIISERGFPSVENIESGVTQTVLFSLKDDVDPSAYQSTKDKLAKLGEFDVIIAEEIVTTFQAFIKQFIYLMQGFLSFALIVGLAGLGIIMLRSVQERRQQIGMLRSLGFSRSMILNAFIIEASMIGILGVLIGTVTGMVGGRSLINTVTEDFDGFEVNLPYLEFVLVGIAIYIGTLVFTAWPSIKAARLQPVEATNYPE